MWEIFEAHRAYNDNMLIQRGIDPKKNRSKPSSLSPDEVKEIRQELLELKRQDELKQRG